MINETREMLDDWWSEFDYDEKRTIKINACDVADIRMLVADRDDRITELIAEVAKLVRVLEDIAQPMHHSTGTATYNLVARIAVARAALAEGQGDEE